MLDWRYGIIRLDCNKKIDEQHIRAVYSIICVKGYIMPSNTQLHDMIQWIHIREASNDRIIHPMLDMRLYRCRALPPSIFELLC